MKRLNPKTNNPFIHGDMREDGFVFSRYFLNKVKKDGYFLEQWVSPESIKERLKDGLKRQKQKRTTVEGRAQSLFRSARQRAKERGSEETFTLTWEWIAEKIKANKCEVTGLPFDLSPAKGTSINAYAPSLDKIDPTNKVYSKENTRVVLASVNMALGEHGEEKMLPILKAMIKYIERKKHD